MSLNWSLKKIKGWEELCYDTMEDDKKRLNFVTEMIIFATITVGLREITKKNIDQWELRIEMLTKTDCYLARVPDPDAPEKMVDWNPSRKDLEDHIGLSTNAFPNKSLAKFKADRMKQIEFDAKAAIYRRSA